MSRIALLIAISTLISACSGPSSEELRRMQLLEAQRAEQAARQAQLEAERRQQRIDSRLASAQQALSKKTTLSDQQIGQLFSKNPEQHLSADRIYYQIFDLQPAKYNYGKAKQSFTLVGMRNLPNSAVYSPLFPDESALYQPGQKAKSVLEFALREETELNRIGQPVLKAKGQRWVAATLNFKNSDILQSDQRSWFWEKGLFEDLSWQIAPEVSYPHTAERDLKIQLGFRLCLMKDRCYLESQYRKHPTYAVRAEVLSAMVFNQKTGELMATFINEGE